MFDGRFGTVQQPEGPATKYPGWGMDGARLHSLVPADRWCVSLGDLRFFLREVAREVQQGRIAPTERDAFDPGDNHDGPNMYTVVDAFLKSLTHEAGKMSWALLRNPKGVTCDVFITHCWAEGVYEFIHKVVHSWPARARGAWCCIFANPHNLDIGGLINDPGSSPFAVALRSTSCVMVVPNTRCSIYSRIWCVYEAYLAVESNSLVFTAARAVGVCDLCLRGLLPVAASAALGVLVPRRLSTPVSDEAAANIRAALAVSAAYLVFYFTYPFNRVGLLAQHPVVDISADFLVLAVMSASVGLLAMRASACTWVDCGPYCPYVDPHWECPPRAALWPFAAAGIFAVALFCCKAYDRARFLKTRADGALLDTGFCGILAARASVQADRDRILAAIGDQVAVVEHSLDVLMASGMSTPSLRAAAVQGLDVGSAAEVLYAPAFAGAAAWLAIVGFGLQELSLMGLWNAVTFVFVAVIFCKVPADEKAFLANALPRIFIVPGGLLLLFGPWGGEPLPALLARACSGGAVLSAFGVGCAVLGRSGVARLPSGVCISKCLGGGFPSGSPHRRRVEVEMHMTRFHSC